MSEDGYYDNDDPRSIVHAGQYSEDHPLLAGRTTCCQRYPRDIPGTDRMTGDPVAVTCGGRIHLQKELPTLGAELAELEAMALDDTSVVWIVGAFKGVTARVLAQLYDPIILAFDPQLHAIEHLTALADENPKLRVFPYGLGARDGLFNMREVGNDACSFYGEWNRLSEQPETRAPGVGEMRDIGRLWEEEDPHTEGWNNIDLLILNCEGAEFEILPRMVEVGMFPRVRYVLSQFHMSAEPGPGAFTDILMALNATHRVRWDRHAPGWISWERRPR